MEAQEMIYDFLKAHMDKVAKVFNLELYEDFRIEGQEGLVFMLTQENGMAYREEANTREDAYYYDCDGLFFDLWEGNVNIIKTLEEEQK